MSGISGNRQSQSFAPVAVPHIGINQENKTRKIPKVKYARRLHKAMAQKPKFKGVYE